MDNWFMGQGLLPPHPLSPCNTPWNTPVTYPAHYPFQYSPGGPFPSADEACSSSPHPLVLLVAGLWIQGKMAVWRNREQLDINSSKLSPSPLH